MSISLSIVLLIVSAASTLAAFGGITWREGPEPILNRITPRGWISLVCLLLAFVVGACKEMYDNSENTRKDDAAKLAAQQAKSDADAKQADLQNRLTAAQGKIDLANAQLGTANTEIEALRRENLITQDEITGGKGFPVAFILSAFPDTGNTFPLRVVVNGHAPLSEVSYKVIEGAYHPPTPEELQAIVEASIKAVNGHGDNPMHYVGEIPIGQSIPMGYVIHPSVNGVNTYRIFFDARNGSVSETLDVRFNPQLNIWQYRAEIRSQSTKTPNKLLQREDWIPKKLMPMLYGEGPPH